MNYLRKVLIFSVALLVCGVQSVSLANDTWQTADDLDVGSSWNNHMDPAGDIDWFYFDIAERGWFEIESDSNLDMKCDLFDSDIFWEDADDDSGWNLDFYLATGLPPGRYYVKIYELDGRVGPYDLSSWFTPIDPYDVNEHPDPDDGNGTRATPADFGLNSTLDYSIFPHTDVDWLRLEVPSDGVLEVWTTGSTDTTGHLTNSSGTSLAFSDDTGDLNFYIEEEVSSGTYYVVVQAFGTGEYTVHSEFTEVLDDYDPYEVNENPDPDDDNGTRARADSFTLNSTLDYSISPYADVDWLRLDVPSDGLLEVWTTGSTDTTGHLTNSSGTSLAFSDDPSGNRNFYIEEEVSSGTYYVVVQAFGTGEYTVHSEFTETVAVGETTEPEPADAAAEIDFGVTTPPRSPDAGDTNGWWTGAATLALNDMRDDFQINPADDVDYLSLDVPERGLLELWTTGNIVDTIGILIDSSQNILGADDDSGNHLNFYIGVNVGAGTHYIAVQGYDIGRYAIHSRFTPGGDGADVNNDGVVNVNDLVQVATHFGTTNAQGDVNNDGVVDRDDILLVLDALEGAGVAGTVEVLGAPSHRALTSTTESLRQWIDLAKLRSNPDVEFQNGIAVLEQLLATLLEQEMVPAQTALLPNYPNPFNPETWIPYDLSEPAEVTLSIYSADGGLVRTLALGHQSAGIYKSKSRAAYWDGRNAVGERVASGLYFYTLTAGDFAATRKMLILK